MRNQRFHTTKQKLTAQLLCLTVLLSLLFSMYFVVVEAHHRCEGDDCPICAEIEFYQNLIHQMGNGLPLTTAVAVMLVPIVPMTVPAVQTKINHTLVSQKVRMNH